MKAQNRGAKHRRTERQQKIAWALNVALTRLKEACFYRAFDEVGEKAINSRGALSDVTS